MAKKKKGDLKTDVELRLLMEDIKRKVASGLPENEKIKDILKLIKDQAYE